MPWLVTIARSLVILAHTVWLGGLTFYGVAVIPILHDELPRLDAGQITQRVSNGLNLIGLIALVLWWCLAWGERRRGPTFLRRLRLALLILTSLLLVALAIDHKILDDRLAHYGLDGFYAYHRVYLIVSTIQWAVNVALVPLALAIWDHRAEGDRVP